MSSRLLRIAGAGAVVLGALWLLFGRERGAPEGGAVSPPAPDDAQHGPVARVAPAEAGASAGGAGGRARAPAPGQAGAAAGAELDSLRSNADEDARADAKARERIDKNVADLMRSLAEAERAGQTERARLMRARIGHLKRRRSELGAEAAPAETPAPPP